MPDLHHAAARQRPELVASVATLTQLEAVDDASFDAFYLGQPYCLKVEDNLLVDLDTLARAVGRLRERGKRVYTVSPVIPWQNELPRVRELLRAAEELKVDGVEIHDMGILRIARREHPSLRVHVGHFGNVYNPGTARHFHRLGASRVSPSYELTLEEKRAFTSLDGLEVEVPVHGRPPLGMAHACLLRMELPDRELKACRQQCERPREVKLKGWSMCCVGTALVTAEDLAMAEFLPELLDLGAAAWRLETVFHTPQQISDLGRLYRAGLEEALSGPIERDRYAGEAARIAGGQICNGWYFGRSGRDYVGYTEALLAHPANSGQLTADGGGG